MSSRLLLVPLILFLLGTSCASINPEGNTMNGNQSTNSSVNTHLGKGLSVKVGSFRDAMEKADTQCRGTLTALWVIDNTYVYARRSVMCSDAGVVSMLFYKTSDAPRCTVTESFIGPQTRCDNEEAKAILSSITDPKAADLGLGGARTVKKVF